MTEINGLRLAYLGLIAGLAGGWMWLAIALLLAIPSGDMLDPVRLLASTDPTGRVTTAAEGLVFGVGLVQVVGGAIGLAFAYFVARYFTVRATLAVAAPCFALLTWLALRGGLTALPRAAEPTALLELGLVAASLVYGVLLGACVPTRPQVARAAAA